MRKLDKLIFLIVLVALFISCNKESDNGYSSFKPILIDNVKINDCKWEIERKNNLITVSKKMGQYLLALDYGLGIHIIDLQDLNLPKKIGFYSIPACVDFEVKNQKVYANNYQDFIIIDFSNINSPIITKRDPKVFEIEIKAPDGLEVYQNFKKIPKETTIISYEKIKTQ
jgi:hypothetical protein